MPEEMKMSEEMQLVVSAIVSEMDKRFAQNDKRLEAMDKRFDRMDKRLDQMDQRMDRTEEDMKMYVNMLVDEMGRMESRIDKRFQKVDERFDRMDGRLDSMQHEINACRLACDTVSILMQRVEQHLMRIECLEINSVIVKMMLVFNLMGKGCERFEPAQPFP